MLFEKQIVGTYKEMMYSRCDDTETVFYFSSDDFDGIKREEYPFKASAGHTLQGYIYSTDAAIEGRLVVFDHGFGGGHRAYMKEISLICCHGYTVFAYDHTGCMESGGESPNGLAQSLSDLNDCICAIKSDERFKDVKLSVMGHSWGAFSTLNIAALHPEITHIVAISGFVSVEEMVKTFFSGLLKGYRSAVMKLERETNPRFCEFNAVDSLLHSDVNALLVYSANDPMCKRHHFDILKKGLEEKENVSFLLLENKGHNPNYSDDALKLLDSFTKARAKLLKKKTLTKEQKEAFVESFDWVKMTEQDNEVWAIIFDHLAS
ncbi:MAG: alpha/beta fold hydrolase [Clostridia bacterium]|nr:alpha/beta fold hydrolase [Clostridia bacterium]